LKSMDYPIYKQQGFEGNGQDVPYLALSIAFTLAMFSLELFLGLRQLARYRDKEARLPEALAGAVSEETFRKSSAYGQEKLSFGLFESLIMLSESLALMLLGYLPLLWDKSEQLCAVVGVCSASSNYSEIVKEMMVTTIFFGLSSLHDSLIGLPFILYSTFVIEQRHGFNKSTLALFVKDKLTVLLLTLCIVAPILSIVVLLVRWGGALFYLYVWSFLFAVSLLLLTIYPTVIAPIFNKYTKLESGPIYDAIERLAKDVSFPLTQIYLVDGSRRSAHSNAYFYGFFKVMIYIRRRVGTYYYYNYVCLLWIE
jgi:STE24 endopeptidase